MTSQGVLLVPASGSTSHYLLQYLHAGADRRRRHRHSLYLPYSHISRYDTYRHAPPIYLPPFSQYYEAPARPQPSTPKPKTITCITHYRYNYSYHASPPPNTGTSYYHYLNRTITTSTNTYPINQEFIQPAASFACKLPVLPPTYQQLPLPCRQFNQER